MSLVKIDLKDFYKITSGFLVEPPFITMLLPPAV